MNLVKGKSAILLAAVLALLATSALALPYALVSAQTGSYRIDSVDHQIHVLYSGHVVVSDTIHISGQIPNEFLIGLPYQYSANVLEAVAYDDNHVYEMDLGVQLGEYSGFYGAQVNFHGSYPSTFTVSFTLSNQLITETTSGLLLDFPAYPVLTQSVGTCNVHVVFPSNPLSISIAKDDGAVKAANYQKTSLPAYTYAIGLASFQVPLGSMQLMTISDLTRTVNVDSAGNVAVSDKYVIVNNSTNPLYSFAFNVPTDATNILITDNAGQTLPTLVGDSANANTKLANATLSSFVAQDEQTILTVQYNLPSVTMQGSQYVLDDFMLFPQLFYYVNHASVVFNPPEGATIISPQSGSLDTSSTLSRNIFQDTFTITRQGVSPVDSSVPQENVLQFAYTYNAVWASLQPTFWAFLLAAVGCVAMFAVNKHLPAGFGQSLRFSRRAKTKIRFPMTSTPIDEVEEEKPEVAIEVGPDERVTAELINNFMDVYDDRKHLSAELKALDSKASKGKIQRRQYKVQRRAVESKIKAAVRNTERTKAIMRQSSSVYADIAKQLDGAEADLAETEGNIRNLDLRYSNGELPLDYYKKTLLDYQKRRERAESNINGILLRLREKIRSVT